MKRTILKLHLIKLTFVRVYVYINFKKNENILYSISVQQKFGLLIPGHSI